MVTIALGRAGSGKTRRIIEKMARNAENGAAGQIYLVPEQNAFNAERELCAVAGNRISASAEVFSFKSLCTRVFSVTGGLAHTMLEPPGQLLLMYRAAKEAEGGLGVLRRGLLRPETLKKLVSAVTEFKNYGVQPEDLPSEGEDSALLGKLCDISLIYSKYEELLSSGLKDPADRLDMLAKKAAESGFFKGRSVFIDGFNSFTPAEERVLEVILTSAKEVCAALCASEELQGRGARGVFAEAGETALRLVSFCADRGIGVGFEEDFEPKRFKNPALRAVEKCFSSRGTVPFPGETGGAVALYAAADPRSECEAAAAAALRAVYEDGYRFRDICVAARSLSVYGGLLPSVFEKYGVPFFLDRKEPLLSKAPVRALLCALDARAGGKKAADMQRLIKTGYAGIPRDGADALSAYAEKWSLRGGAWDRPLEKHPGGFAKPWTKAAAEELACLEVLRGAVAGPLAGLPLKGAADGLAALAFEYCEAVDMPGQIAARAEGFSAAGEARRAQEYAQVWELICGAFDQLVFILGDTQVSLREFSDMLRVVFEGESVGSIPAVLDAVSVGEAGRMRSFHPRMTIVLGATEDILPAKPEERGILTAAERKKLLKMLKGGRLAPSAYELAFREELITYQTLCSPSERLLVMRHKAAQSGERAEPSPVVDRLLRLFPDVQEEEDRLPAYKTEALRPCAELAAAAERYPGEALYAAARAAVLCTEEGRTLLRAPGGGRGSIEDKKLLERLYGGEWAVSASRIEKFGECPFAFFAEYGLRLDTNEKAEMSPADTGSMVHFVLERTALELKERGIPWGEAGGETLKAIAAGHIRSYKRDALHSAEESDGRLRFLLGRIEGQIYEILGTMGEEFSQSEFVPAGFEVAFGGAGADYPPLTLEADGVRAKLVGKVDRVDTWERDGTEYIRVVDYKLGNKKFSYTDVAGGTGIQLLVYLFLLSEARGCEPAAAIYMQTVAEAAAADAAGSEEEAAALRGQKFSRSGVVLNDPEVIFAMEKPGAGKGRFVPVTFTSSLAVHSRSEAAVSGEELALLREHVKKTALCALGGMYGGDTKRRPYETAERLACDYCAFGLVCQFDRSRAGDEANRANKITKAEFYNAAKGGGDRGDNLDGGAEEGD